MQQNTIKEDKGKQLLIHYWFKHDLHRIQNRFKVEVLTSSDSIKKWNEGKIQIAAIHPASAGHGLTIRVLNHPLVSLNHVLRMRDEWLQFESFPRSIF